MWLMQRELERYGVRPNECQGKIFGGANMFPGQTAVEALRHGEHRVQQEIGNAELSQRRSKAAEHDGFRFLARDNETADHYFVTCLDANTRGKV